MIDKALLQWYQDGAIELTAEQIEKYRRENMIALAPEHMEPWAHEENRVLNALCDFALKSILKRK